MLLIPSDVSFSFSLQIPYKVTDLKQGLTIPSPNDDQLPGPPPLSLRNRDLYFDIMTKCLQREYKLRPTFLDIVNNLVVMAMEEISQSQEMQAAAHDKTPKYF